MAYAEGVNKGGDMGETSLYGWLTYWLYEAKDMGGGEVCEVTDEHGNKYNFKKRKEVIKFLENNF